MVDEDVETTLREIRERVRQAAESEARFPRAVVTDDANRSLASTDEAGTKVPETIARIDAYLTTTARAWDRLPPIVSNRSGALARLELWVKRRLKQGTRWYSWEQINFNAAVHHALRDTLDALVDLEARLGQLRAEMQTRTQQLEQNQMAQRAEIESQQAALVRQLADVESQRSALESQRVEMEAHRTQMEAEQRVRSLELNARLAELAKEFRERNGQTLEEQRVCFKQLSLEMSEAEVLLDRARRDIESRLVKLEGGKAES